MDERTKAALKSCIEDKWKGIRYGGGKDNRPNDCKLCLLFYLAECRGCPVYEFTEEEGCDNTPYGAWREHQHYFHADSHFQWTIHPDCEECVILCDAQIAFLESLLPYETAPPNLAVAPDAEKPAAPALT